MSFDAIQDKLGISDRASDIERRLDEAVADSFPASDPVSLAQPHDPSELGLSHKMTPSAMMLVGGGLLALLAVIALRWRR